MYIDYFMGSVCVPHLHMSWWCVRDRTSERSEQVRFLMQTNKCENAAQRSSYAVICLFFVHTEIFCEMVFYLFVNEHAYSFGCLQLKFINILSIKVSNSFK